LRPTLEDMNDQIMSRRVAIKRGNQITAPASREVRNANQSQFTHKVLPPEIPVEKAVERAVVSHAGRSVHPPRDREVDGSEKFRRSPRQSNRRQRQQKRNDPPFAGVCAVAVHTSPARLCKADQVLLACLNAPSTPIAAGKRRVEEMALVLE
jgi:hypothetical protein